MQFDDDFANQRHRYPLTRDRAFEILLNTHRFNFSRVGIEPGVPPQIHAFNVLFDLPDARDVFLDLFDRAHPAGRIYALTAMSLLDRSKFDLIRNHIEPTTMLVSYAGCVGQERTAAMLIHEIESGDVAKFFRAEAKEAERYFAEAEARVR